MQWLIEHSIWVLLALIIFTAAWFVAFFARNYQAKNDHEYKLEPDTKDTGSIPLKRSDKV